MFLSVKSMLMMAVYLMSFFSASAKAQSISQLKVGDYALESGPSNLCLDFTLTPEDLVGNHLLIGGMYSFNTLNSTSKIESDIDPTCEFKEQNQRETIGEQTVLNRINKEFCRGKLRSKTVSAVALSQGQITLHHEVENAPAYKCVWKTK